MNKEAKFLDLFEKQKGYWSWKYEYNCIGLGLTKEECAEISQI